MMRLPFCLKRHIISHVSVCSYSQISICINILCISIVIAQEIIAFSYRYRDWISCCRSVFNISKRLRTIRILIPAGLIFLVNSRASRLPSISITMVIIQSQCTLFCFPYSIKCSMAGIIIIGTISFCIPIIASTTNALSSFRLVIVPAHEGISRSGWLLIGQSIRIR